MYRSLKKEAMRLRALVWPVLALLLLLVRVRGKQRDFYSFKAVNSRGKLVSLEKYRGTVSDTQVYTGLQRSTEVYTGLHRSTEVYTDLHRSTEVYRGL